MRNYIGLIVTTFLLTISSASVYAQSPENSDEEVGGCVACDEWAPAVDGLRWDLRPDEVLARYGETTNTSLKEDNRVFVYERTMYGHPAELSFVFKHGFLVGVRVEFHPEKDSSGERAKRLLTSFEDVSNALKGKHGAPSESVRKNVDRDTVRGRLYVDSWKSSDEPDEMVVVANKLSPESWTLAPTHILVFAHASNIHRAEKTAVPINKKKLEEFLGSLEPFQTCPWDGSGESQRVGVTLKVRVTEDGEVSVLSQGRYKSISMPPEDFLGCMKAMIEVHGSEEDLPATVVDHSYVLNIDPDEHPDPEKPARLSDETLGQKIDSVMPFKHCIWNGPDAPESIRLPVWIQIDTTGSVNAWLPRVVRRAIPGSYGQCIIGEIETLQFRPTRFPYKAKWTLKLYVRTR